MEDQRKHSNIRDSGRNVLGPIQAQSTQDARRKQTEPVDVNGGVHTARKQHQRKNVPICARVASHVLCGLGPTLDARRRDVTRKCTLEPVANGSVYTGCKQHRKNKLPVNLRARVLCRLGLNSTKIMGNVSNTKVYQGLCRRAQSRQDHSNKG